MQGPTPSTSASRAGAGAGPGASSTGTSSSTPQREVASAGRELQVALNTIPKPGERARLLERVPALLELGIRTVIVNDIGILSALGRRYPDLRLTASIGCGAQTVADVAFFRDLGAHAVVLPGTVSPAEMREVRTVRGHLR